MRYSTIASGPLSTCSPVGMACVLIPGTIDRAVDWMCSASSAVHMDAQNYRAIRQTSAWPVRILTRTLGLCCVTFGTTSSMPTRKKLVLGGCRVEGGAGLTLTVVDVFNVVFVLERLDEPPNEALRPIGRSVDCHQSKRSLAFRHLYGVTI